MLKDCHQQVIPGISVTLDELIKTRHQASVLPLNSKKKVFAQQIGGHVSGFRGRGIDFDEARSYQPGDDIRHMDWRVTARTGHAHTKVFQEERERPVYLLVDHNPSMYFATKVAFKSVLAAKIAALLAWGSVQHGDRIGGMIFGKDKLINCRPRGRKFGVLPFLKALAESSQTIAQSYSDHSLPHALAHLQRVIKPGSLVFLISDFSQLDTSCEKYLSQLTVHNNFYACYIQDPIEIAPPPPNRYAITHDNGSMLILNTHNRRFSDEYAHLCDNIHQQVKQTLHKNRIPVMPCLTTDDAAHTLQHNLYYWQDLHGKS